MFLFRDGFQDSFFANLLAGLMIAFLFFIFKEKVFRIPNIGGIFYLRQRTENTVYNPYKEMELQYMLSLRLEGNKVYGSAEKIYENASVGKGKEHIIHYEGNGFYIYDENKEILARLEYKRNDNVLIFDHTVVSDKLKGQGIAQKLLDEAVDYARKNNFKVHPVCSYVVKKFETGNYDDIKA